MIKADFHTHTTFCDGKSTPREMVEAACRLGFTSPCSFVKDTNSYG